METNAEQIVSTAVELISTWGIGVVGAIAVLIIGRIVAAAIRNAVTRGLERANVDPSLVPFVAKLAYYAVLAVVLVFSLRDTWSAVADLFGSPG